MRPRLCNAALQNNDQLPRDFKDVAAMIGTQEAPQLLEMENGDDTYSLGMRPLAVNTCSAV